MICMGKPVLKKSTLEIMYASQQPATISVVETGPQPEIFL